MPTPKDSSPIGLATGAFLILAGLVAPGSWLIDVLHGPAGDQADLLATGATLFKTALIAVGTLLVGFALLPNQPLATPPQLDAKSGRNILLVLLGVALLMRLFQLNEGIWLDEMLTHEYYLKPMSAGEIFTTLDDENNHILHTLLAELSIGLFGTHTWSLRLPAVLFGVGSIWAMYAFARHVTTTAESLFAAALFAFSYHHLWFSQNARGYTALLFFTLLSSLFLVKALRTGEKSSWLLYAITAALGAFSHLTMGFVVVGQAVVWAASVVKRRGGEGSPWWLGFAGFALTGMLCFLFYAFVLPQMMGGGLSTGVQDNVEEWTNPVWMVLEVVRGFQLNFSGAIVGTVAMAVFGLGLIDYLRKAPVVPTMLIVPSTLGLMVMLRAGYTLFPRFFFFAMGFGVLVVIRGALLSGSGLGRLLKLNESKQAMLGNVACIGMIAVSALSVPFAFGPKQDYVGAMELVNSELQSGDVVVTLGNATLPYSQFYGLDWRDVTGLDELNALRRQHARTWVVYTTPVHTEAVFPAIIDVLNEDFTRLGEFPGTINGGEVVVWREDG